MLEHSGPVSPCPENALHLMDIIRCLFIKIYFPESQKSVVFLENTVFLESLLVFR